MALRCARTMWERNFPPIIARRQRTFLICTCPSYNGSQLGFHRFPAENTEVSRVTSRHITLHQASAGFRPFYTNATHNKTVNTE
jgi:hypothetical protein